MSRQFFACCAPAQPDGRGPAQLHPRWAYSGRIFAAAMRGGRRRFITPLESAGSAEMAHIGDFSDSSGTYTTPQAALWARRQAQAKRRRDAKTQCQLGVLFVPVGFREAAAMASR